jgi:hypothetical protein
MTWPLAHQGGWDELLLFATPIVLAFLVMRALERRSRRRRSSEEPSSTPLNKSSDAADR